MLCVLEGVDTLLVDADVQGVRAFHHELSRPMRMSWLPANGTMQAAFAAVCVDTEGILPAVKR